MENSFENNSFSESLKSVLNDLDEITVENKQVIKDLQNYNKELKTLVNNSNEFANLTPEEIDKKLEDMLNEVLSKEQNNDTNDNLQVVSENNTVQESNPIEYYDSVEHLEEQLKILEQMNTQLYNSVNNIIIPNKITNNNIESDNSTIDPADLDTESESDGDLEEVDESKIKQEVNISSDLFKMMESQMSNLNINDLFANIKEMPNLDDPEKLKTIEERMKVMTEQLKGFNFENMFQMMGQMESIHVKENTEETEDLSSFLIEEENTQNQESNDLKSETESYYETDNENEENNKNEVNKETGPFNIFNNLGPFNKIFNMFGLFGNSKGVTGTTGPTGFILENSEKIDENIISKSLSSQNVEQVINDKDGIKENSESDKSIDEITENKVNVDLKFNDFLNQNKKMFEDINRMMQTLGLDKQKTE